MANDDFDLDDFDFEDFDIDIPDFEVEAASDDRKPVEKLRSGFFQGAKDHVTSVDTLEQSLKLALPEGYSAAFNAKDTAISSIKELYHTAADELKPVTTAVKNSVKKISPKVKEKLPRFIQNKIDDIQNEVEFNQQSAAAAKRENEDSQIASVMQEIFRTQMEVEQERRNEENGQELVSRTIETNQRNSLIESANIVAKGMDRVVGYQDNILSKYHQKSLELQFRHYFVAKDLLDLTSVHQGKIEEALSTITKNTALPEAVKIEKSELAGQLIKERLLNSSIDGIAGFASRYRDKLMGNAKNFIGGVAGSIGMGASMASSMPEGIDKSTMAGEMFGGMAAQYATEWASRELGERIKGNDQIRRGNAKLLNIFSPGGMSRKISQWGRSETKGSGWLSLGVDMLKSLVPQFYANDKVRDNPMFSSDKPAIYDQLARRSITEVIPTYLSQIAHWTKATATGTIDGDMSVYSLHRGGMTTKSNMLEDVKRVIMPRRDNITAKNEIDSFVDKMFDGREISDEAKSALRRQILVDVASNQTFDPRRYSKFEGFKDSKGEESAIEELITLFRERFSVDEDGEYDADDTDTLMNRTENEQRFNRLAGVIPTPDGRIRALVDAVGMDSLRELGMIKRVNREDKIDYEKVFDLILSDKEDEAAEPYQSIFDQTVTDKSFVEALKEKAKKLAAGTPQDSVAAEDGDEQTTAANQDQLAAISKLKGGKEKSGGRSISDIKITGIQARVDTLVMDPYLGEDSPVIRELKAIQTILKGQKTPEITIDGALFQENNEYQKAHSEYLEAILEAIRSIEVGGQGTPAAGSWRDRLREKVAGRDTLLGGLNSIRNSRLGRGVGWTKDKLKSAGGAYLEGTKNFYKTLGSGSWSLGKLGFTGGIKGITWTGKKLFERDATGDILVMGRKVPALRKSLIEAGEYIDVKTKKVIRSAADITGEVRDKAGNIILGEEDFKKGLTDVSGKPLILRIAKRAFDFGSSLLTPYKWAWDVVVGAKNYVKDKIEHLSDGYLRGEKIPRLRASIMKEGGYFDQATRKVIKSFKDVTGTVVDKNGNIIATAEEIRASGGFFNAIGDRIKERSSSLFKGIGKGVGGIGSGVASLAGSALNAYGSMFKAAGSAIGAVGSAFTSPFSAFGFGFGGPQADKLLTLNYAQTAYQAEILKVLLEGRKGRGKNKKGGDIDESWRSMDLKGDDVSRVGFSNPLKGMKNPFSKLSLKNPLKNLSLPKGKLGELFKGKKEDLLAEKDKRMAQVLAMITENQLSIKDKLENAKKKVLGDSDGDGTRDGAWWTRKRKGNTTTQTKAKEGEKKSGIFGLLSAAMPLVVSGLTFIGTKIAGLAKALGLAKAAGALAGALGSGPDVGGGKKGLLRRGVGLLGRGMWGAAKLAGTATLGIGGLAARAVGFAAFKAVPAIVGALGSVLSAPVALGVVAAAGVGYLGYKIYKHYTTDSGPIFRIRMNQYGFSPNDKSNLAKIAKLESIHWKHTAFLGGKVTINGRDINFQDVMEIFDIDLSDTSDENKQRMQTWMHWYENRFVPVYKVHAAAVKSLGESNDFESFESSIKPEKALEVIEAVKLSDMASAFNDMISPFEGEVLDRDAEAVKKAVDEGIAHYKEKLGKKDGTSSATTPSGVVATAAATTVAAGTSSVSSTGAEITKATAFKEGLKKGLLAGAMVLAAPVLIPAAIVGKALGLAGVDVKKLTAGQVVRLKAYGLTTLDSEKVNLLLEMEQKAIKDIKFDGQKQGIWAGVDDSYLDRYGSRFGVSTAEDKERWIRWFSGRFLPTLVQFATSVKTRANVPILDAESRIRGNTLRTVLSETIGATAALDGMNLPIWQVTDSPWSDYPLNTDRQSAEKTIESIEKVNDVHGDILGEDKKIKPKGVEDVDSTEEDKKGVLSKVMDKMKTAGQNALSAAKEKGTALWNGLTDKLAAARDKVVETIASVPGASSIMGKVGNPSENREAIINVMLEAGITDPKEQAAFMAQLDHESGGFKHVRENLNYSAQGLLKVFSKYYKSSALAQQEARNPEAIANRVYGGRMGNEQPGEGFKYRGRGFIQLTGKSNYVQASKALGIDLVNNPDMAEDPATAAKIAVWFWKKSGAGDAARAGDLRASRRAVNGGYNGMSDVQGKFNTYLSQALAGKFQPSGEKPGTSETGTAVASSESPTAAAPTDTTGGSTTPVATGLTTVASPSTPAAVTAPVAAPVAVSEPVVEAPQPSAKSPELRAKIADTQSSKIETLTDQHMSAMTSILEKQLSIQSSIDGRLAQVVQLLKNGATPVPSSPSTSKDTPRTVSAPATPMPKSPVSMSRSV